MPNLKHILLQLTAIIVKAFIISSLENPASFKTVCHCSLHCLFTVTVPVAGSSLGVGAGEDVEVLVRPHGHLAQVLGEGGGARVAVHQVERVVQRRQRHQRAVRLALALLGRHVHGLAAADGVLRHAQVQHRLEARLLVVLSGRQQLWNIKSNSLQIKKC